MINKLLIVGTSPIIEQLFKISLMDSNIEVATASSTDEAQNIISSKRPDVVFVDSGIKEKNPFDFARAIKLNHGKGVVLLKASSDSWDQEEFNHSKADSILKKPFEPEALMSVLEKFNGNNETKSIISKNSPSRDVKEPLSVPKKKISEENRKSAISLLKKAELENAKKFISSNLVKKSRSGIVKNSKPIIRESFEKEGFAISEEELDARVNKISTEVIERVVWEVVPKLAEKIIKEELKRLTEE